MTGSGGERLEHGAPPGLPWWLDRVIAGTALATLSPLMLTAALAIKVESRGPVLFRHSRIGRQGDPFTLLKLRTFQHNAPPEGTWVPLDEATDPRITRVGRILRRTSLDEVPNLVNVLRGDMAIVGPRPTIAAQVAEYNAFQRRRLEVLPGLTGWAQVNGRTSLSWAERIELDVWYVEHRTPAFDLLIMWRTMRLALSRSGGSIG